MGPGRQPDPGGEVATGIEVGDIRQCSDRCAGGDRANSGDGLHALRGIIGADIRADVRGQSLALLPCVDQPIDRQVRRLAR